MMHSVTKARPPHHINEMCHILYTAKYWRDKILANACLLSLVSSYTLKDSNALSTPINKISCSKEVLKIYGLNLAQCVCTELDTLFPTLIL